MLLDQYLVPLFEILISILLPLVLTLKTLQISHQAPNDAKYSMQMLMYWTLYWPCLFLLEMADVNSHFRSLFTLFYLSQHQAVLVFLLKFYHVTLLPFASERILRPMNLSMSEVELDQKIGVLLWKVCFDTSFIEKSIGLFTNRSTVSHSESTSRASSSHNQGRIPSFQTSEQTESYDMPSLNIPKQRGAMFPVDQFSVNRDRNSSAPIGFTDMSASRASKVNLKSRNVSFESSISIENLCLPTSHDQLSSHRVSSDSVLNGEPLNSSQRKFFRKGIKDLFIG